MNTSCSPRPGLLLLAAFALLTVPTPASAVIEWVVIGDAGNDDDSQPQGSFGGVGYEYSISRFETTNAEYVAFLNAKAASDPLGLYNPSMASDPHGGITRAGTPGTYSYAVKSGFESKPVNFVSFFDALRFANWMHNGEGGAATETGAYTLLGGTEIPSNGASVGRNASATVALPTQDEWFKAAYYDGVAGVYYDFPAGTDDTPTCGSPSATPNRANCGDSAIRGVTEVGAYTGSASPYGTFDQGGNVAERNENTAFGGGRAVRGGGWTGLTTPLKASSVGSFGPEIERSDLGFRLVLLEADPGGGPLDIAEIRLSKLFERADGTPLEDPYVFEACVSGTGIELAEVSPPGADPIVLEPVPPGTELCVREFFAGSAELDQAYPNGEYEFLIFGEQGGGDSKTLNLQAAEPGAFLSISSPSDGAIVPEGQDLDFAWTLVEKSNGVGCIAGMSCAETIAVEIVEFDVMNSSTIVEESLPISATDLVVPASELQTDAFYEATIGAFSGPLLLGDTTDMGDETRTRAVYGDVNRIGVLVPEPAGGLLGFAALWTLAALRRARMGGCRRARAG